MGFKSCINRKAFTLLELIVVIIIIGILATVGLNQYTNITERGRLGEAKTNIGLMRKLAYEYYLKNGSFTSIQNSNVGVDGNTLSASCRSSNFYRYWVGSFAESWINLAVTRCSSGGKSPNIDLRYTYYLNHYTPSTGAGAWACYCEDTGCVCPPTTP